MTVVANGLDDIPSDERVEGVDYISVPMVRDPAPIRDLISLSRLFITVKRVRPNAVLYATPKASLLTAIAASVLGVPSRTYQLWGLRLETVDGPSRHFLYAMECLTASLSHRVIANSESLRARAIELGVANANRILVLGKGTSHGVDTDHFKAGATGNQVSVETQSFLASQPGVPVVGFVGRLHPDKGLDVLADALGILRVSGPPALLLVIGEDEGFLASQHGQVFVADERVHLVGPVQDVRPYYEVMDTLVLPSRREGFPNVVLEAASMGVPAVVTDATGVIDSVVADETGIIVPADAPEPMAAALELVISNSAIREGMGRMARNRAIEHFRHDLVLEQFVSYLHGQVTTLPSQGVRAAGASREQGSMSSR